MRLTPGDKGELLDINPRYLLVPPQLERTAWELIRSAGRPDTANRADNWLATQNLQIIVWNRLDDPDAWFLLTEKDYHNLIFYNRIELETDSDRDFNTKDYLYSVITRFSVGWADWRGVEMPISRKFGESLSETTPSQARVNLEGVETIHGTRLIREDIVRTAGRPAEIGRNTYPLAN